MSNESSNSNNMAGGYYINHNNAVYFVDENGAMNPRNLILDGGRNSESEVANQNGYPDPNNSCLLIKPAHFRSEQLNGNMIPNNGSNVNSNSTFTELQPAANLFNQASNMENKNLVYR